MKWTTAGVKILSSESLLSILFSCCSVFKWHVSHFSFSVKNQEGGSSLGNSCYVLICAHQGSQTRLLFTQKPVLMSISKRFLNGRKDPFCSWTNSFPAQREEHQNSRIRYLFLPYKIWKMCAVGSENPNIPRLKVHFFIAQIFWLPPCIC